ncbi:MAG: hypothetical protein ACRC62_37740 [Microcoleus sp.]
MPADNEQAQPQAPPADEPKMVAVKVSTDRPVDGRRKGEEFQMEENAAKFFKEAKLVEIVK